MYLTAFLCSFLHFTSELCLTKTNERRELQALQVKKRASRSKCCGDLGCFSTAYPFTSKVRPLSFLPKCPDELEIKYTVFSRRNVHVGYDIRPGNKQMLQKSDFNASRPTKVVIHGFIEDTDVGKWMHDMKDAFLMQRDFNVILVDWGKGSGLPYTQATANTRVVGAELAQLIHFLQVQKGVTPESFHVIGHSLGSHIAGYTGERLQYLGRITALDPADPYFSGSDKTVRLDPGDALFVDVMHTDGDHFLSTLKFDGGFGMSDAVGHADYYPNGGEDQPGCDTGMISSIVISGIYDGGKKFVACDHLRVYDYFTESINSKCPFMAYPCDNYDDFVQGKCGECGADGCGNMGFLADKNIPSKPTKYFLDTGDNFPFCRYHFQIKVKIGSDGRDEHGKIYVIIYGSDDSTDEIQLSADDEFLKPGETYTYSIKLKKDVGSLKSLDFKWKQTTIYTKPSHWTWFRTPSLQVENVKVTSGVQSQKKSFCSDIKSIDTQVRESLKPCS